MDEEHLTDSYFPKIVMPNSTVTSHTLNSYLLNTGVTLPNGSIFTIDTPEKGVPMIGLDFETRAERDLTVVGLDNYVNDPEFRVLLAAVAYEGGNSHIFDFVEDYDYALMRLREALRDGTTIVAHNVSFERAVLQKLGIHIDSDRTKDSAVIARAYGAASKLEHVAPQLLLGSKLPAGSKLIQKFSIGAGPLPRDVILTRDWHDFRNYCLQDARLSLDIWMKYARFIRNREDAFELVTYAMNQRGWPVDMQAVHDMYSRYQENMEKALDDFRTLFDPDGKLNFNSLKQMKEWCAARGVRATSFSEENVIKLLARVEAKLETKLPDNKWRDYDDVRQMLQTKLILGGSSLKKLQVLMDTVGPGNRLRNQYMHVGAGQSYRTSGRGVQMQNLKRLHSPRDMSQLADPATEWTNDELAENIRQLFTASTPDGQLIVGDLSSIESRGLGYLAGAGWKLKAFYERKDLYKVQAAAIYNIDYADVTAEQRQTGKVGELSCGYGAGASAVVSFAQKMGVTMTEPAAADLVFGWRSANPQVVALWELLDDALKEAVTAGAQAASSVGKILPSGLLVEFAAMRTPESLLSMHPGAVSIQMSLSTESNSPMVRRMFHGCYIRGRNVCFYKPDVKNGKLWSNGFIDPKTKEFKFYSLYGGKLAGILTQSFCREMFFNAMLRIETQLVGVPGIELIGQFHDEVVLDWDPAQCSWSIDQATSFVYEQLVREPFTGFPMEAKVQHDYRYIK